jgi:glycine/sarcosine N-methyltransferase
MSSPNEFYAELAADYDRMTRFEERVRSEEAILSKWRERYGFNSALDAGCGTGLHAVVLARLGVRTVASDLSAEMLEQARRNAVEQEVRVEWVQADFTNLAERIKGPFEALLCLGNSLPHVLSPEDLARTFDSFSRLITGEGPLVVQILNYERILARAERIVGIAREQNLYFVRFYDFLTEFVQFNVLRIRTEQGKITHTLNSTLLRPYREPQLRKECERVGFSRLDCFGDLNFSPFDPGKSPNLILVARR